MNRKVLKDEFEAVPGLLITRTLFYNLAIPEMTSTKESCHKEVNFDHPEKDCLRLHYRTFRQLKRKLLLG